MRVSTAAQYCHDLLAKEHFASTRELLEEHNERLSVAGRPVCTVLRPLFLDEQTYAYIRHASTLVMQGISVLVQHLLQNAELRKEMDLSEEEEELVQIDTGYGAADASARLDGFLTSEGAFHFVEYNADSPGGVGYGDALSDVFSGMPLLKAFSRRYPYRTLAVRSYVSDVLLSAYRRWGGKAQMPNIAILDWKNVSTLNEFQLFLREFELMGCPARIGSPEELDYRSGRLYLGDFPVDLVYKRLVVAEMLAKLGLNNPLVRAVRERAVCAVNGFAVQMVFKKALFALLSDPVHSNLFEEGVLSAIRTHIPWTRILQECRTVHGNSELDLVPFVLSNRERLVLKPNSEYGGRGVVLGWECDEKQWEESIRAGLKAPHVIQERVPVGSELFPSAVDGSLRFDERYFDLDPYVWDGKRVEGCGVRLSKLALLNVSAGGGSATPLFIIRN